MGLEKILIGWKTSSLKKELTLRNLSSHILISQCEWEEDDFIIEDCQNIQIQDSFGIGELSILGSNNINLTQSTIINWRDDAIHIRNSININITQSKFTGACFLYDSAQISINDTDFYQYLRFYNTTNIQLRNNLIDGYLLLDNNSNISLQDNIVAYGGIEIDECSYFIIKDCKFRCNSFDISSSNNGRVFENDLGSMTIFVNFSQEISFIGNYNDIDQQFIIDIGDNCTNITID